jgi:ABC-type antimicrobial peptide transport system permease subunit
VAARTAIGVALGAISGWRQGSYLDRFILGLAEVIASFPTLLLAMILILALGIRRGMPPFIVALCFVGWGEIMQFVRGQVIVIRPLPYIENAVAVGARTPRIVVRHVLPHLFSALVSIVALEMGSVLTLLGELGFISIFIGGGIVAVPATGRRLLYSDVPEWGALLSDLRYLARTYSWTALYPMAAFFVSILSFNLFGEGVRRLVERGELIVHRLVNRYTVALVAVVAIALLWLRSHSGALSFYEQHARTFDGRRASAYVAALSDPQMEGRALGTSGMDRAAEYIAGGFDALELQASGQKGTFFQERAHAFERLENMPTFTIDDGGPLLAYSEDYAAYPGPETMVGAVHGPVRFIGLGRRGQVVHGAWRPVYAGLDRADFSDEILLVLSPREASTLTWLPKGAMLVVADDPVQLGQRYTIGGRKFLSSRNSPRLWISERVANRLLSNTGHTVAALREKTAELAVEEVYQLPLSTQAGVHMDGVLEEKWPVRHVLGYLPGTHSYDFCADCLGKQLIVVMVQYDNPPLGPGSVTYPAANDNASGVAVMLEAIRVIQETDYQPYKTFLFVAYSGEGLEGGEYVRDPDVKRFLQARAGLSRHKLEAIVHLHLADHGADGRLAVSASGSLRLAKLLEKCAKQMGAGVVRADEAIDVSVIYEEGGASSGERQDAPTVHLFWAGGDDPTLLSTDGQADLSAADLEKAGRTLAMALMILGREINY